MKLKVNDWVTIGTHTDAFLIHDIIGDTVFLKVPGNPSASFGIQIEYVKRHPMSDRVANEI